LSMNEMPQEETVIPGFEFGLIAGMSLSVVSGSGRISMCPLSVCL
jgi:hypothetical protein